MIQEIIAFDAAYRTLKAKAISILHKANLEKGIDNINFADHNMQCRVIVGNRYGDEITHTDVIGIRIIDTPQPQTIQIETSEGLYYISQCEGWCEIELYKEIIAYEDEIMNLQFE